LTGKSAFYCSGISKQQHRRRSFLTVPGGKKPGSLKVNLDTTDSSIFTFKFHIPVSFTNQEVTRKRSILTLLRMTLTFSLVTKNSQISPALYTAITTEQPPKKATPPRSILTIYNDFNAAQARSILPSQLAQACRIAKCCRVLVPDKQRSILTIFNAERVHSKGSILTIFLNPKTAINSPTLPFFRGKARYKCLVKKVYFDHNRKPKASSRNVYFD
jgi:hypothetical protein